MPLCEEVGGNQGGYEPLTHPVVTKIPLAYKNLVHYFSTMNDPHAIMALRFQNNSSKGLHWSLS
jgi:hypothetical protein